MLQLLREEKFHVLPVFLNHGPTGRACLAGEVSYMACKETPAPSAVQEEGCAKWPNWPVPSSPWVSSPCLAEQTETPFHPNGAGCEWCDKVCRTSQENCSNKLGDLYCNKSDYCRLILQMFFSVINHTNKYGCYCQSLYFEGF